MLDKRPHERWPLPIIGIKIQWKWDDPPPPKNTNRPVDLPRFVRVLNERYRALASPGAASQVKPVAIIDFHVPAAR